MSVAFFCVTLVAKINRKIRIKGGGQECSPHILSW